MLVRKGDVNGMVQGCLGAAWSAGYGMEGLRHLDIMPPKWAAADSDAILEASVPKRREALAAANEVLATLKGVIDAGMGFLDAGMGFLGVNTVGMSLADASTAAEAFYEHSGNVFPFPVVARAVEAASDIAGHAQFVSGGAWVDFGRVIAERGAALKRNAHEGLDIVGAHQTPPVRFVANGGSLSTVPMSVN